MLSRYQTGPFATIVFFSVMALTCVYGLHVAVLRHKWNGWLIAVTALLSLYNFHKRFSRDIN